MPIKLENVLITDDVDPKCVKILQDSGVSVEVNTKLAKDKDALLAEIPKYDGLIVRSATKVTADVINASNLSIIGRAGTGTDNIDSNAATKKGVIVMNTPGGNTISAAELTCAMICALSRNLGAACISMKEGRWDRKLFMGEELQGKTLAIVGLGRIGREVGQRMRSFGMKTIGYDPLVSPEQSAQFQVTSYPLDELWPLADYITIHVPLLPATKNLINADVFSKCKPGVKVINCARGGIIDEQALLDALNNKQCGGAGLDVYAEEPPKNLDMVRHPNVLAAPHLGASTKEAQSRVAVEIAEQFIEARDGKSLFGAINAGAMAQALSPESQTLIELSRSLGVIVASATKQSPQTLNVTVSGDKQMEKSVSVVQAAVCMGATSVHLSETLNLINSTTLAQKAGLQVSISYSSANTNSVTVSCDGVLSLTAEVQGILSQITSINSMPVSVVLMKDVPYLLLLKAKDIQAILGSLYSKGIEIGSVNMAGPSDDNVLIIQMSKQLSNLEDMTSLATRCCLFNL